MKILLICNKSPWPPREGGPIAMNAIAEGLINAGHQVKILAINSYKYKIDVNSIPKYYAEKTRIELVFIDLKVRVIPAFLNLFTSKSYHVQRFISADFSNAIKRILKEEEFDVIQLESLFITPYVKLIREYSKAVITLRAHNIEHKIWERLSIGEKSFLKRAYLKHLARTLRLYELEAIQLVDGIVAITQSDADYFSNYVDKGRIISIPFGIDTATSFEKKGEHPEQPFNNTIFHLGSMNWKPNLEGIIWFLKEVWPELSKSDSSVKFHLAGREMPQEIFHFKSDRVIIDGEVPDALEYMNKFKVMVVPLFSGSGIRIKIIEGMLAGCAVITTSIGAEGINYSNGENILIANNKEAFIENVIFLFNHPEKIFELGKKASEFVKEEHNNQRLISKLESFYSQIIK